jgi:hypothetical protein
MPNAVIITAVRWYGYRNCFGDPGTSQVFEISFFLDKEGLPAGKSIYTTQVQARINETKTKITVFEVYVYTADALPPLSIPADQHTWVVISQGFASCNFLWNRSSSVDAEAGVSGIDNLGDNGRFSNWLPLRDHLAFELYGRKLGTVAH